MARDLENELVDINQQLTRYGNLYDERVADLLHEITEINDDLHNGRHWECIEKSVTEMKRQLDELLAERKKR